MIDKTFLEDVINHTDDVLYMRDGYVFGVCYDNDIMGSTVNAYKDNVEMSVPFYACANKPTDIFKKKFFDKMVEMFNDMLY